MAFINASNLNKRVLVVKDRQYDPQTGELSQLLVEINRPNEETTNSGTQLNASSFEIAINGLIVDKLTSDREKVNNDMNSLILSEELNENFILPTLGINNSVITWESSNTNVTINSGVLSIASDAIEEKTNLIATITFDTIQKVKVFTVNVLK